MSFFNELFEDFDIRESHDNLSIRYEQNGGLAVIGNFKVLTLNEQNIWLKTKKELVQIEGEKLMVKTMTKGELVIKGKVFEIKFGDKNVK